jgi:hypothetical protein
LDNTTVYNAIEDSRFKHLEQFEVNTSYCKRISTESLDYNKLDISRFNTASADIVGTDTVVDIISKLSGGVIGAANVLLQYMSYIGQNDGKDSFEMGILTLLEFDEFGILGSDIWLLYKDLCGEKIECVHCIMYNLSEGPLVPKVIYKNIEMNRLHRGLGFYIDIEPYCKNLLHL